MEDCTPSTKGFVIRGLVVGWIVGRSGIMMCVLEYCISRRVRSSYMCHMLQDECSVLCCRVKRLQMYIMSLYMLSLFHFASIALGPTVWRFPDLWSVHHYANRSIIVCDLI